MDYIGLNVIAIHSCSGAEESHQPIRTNPSDVDMAEEEETRQFQVTLVGSEILYKRLDQKLADLEVDSFFYDKQRSLIQWRTEYLREKAKDNYDKIFFLSTKHFDEAVERHGSPDFVFDVPGYRSVGREARTKFLISQSHLMSCLHKEHTDGPCECGSCDWWNSNVFRESAPFMDLIVRSTPLWSLKNLCMAKVLEQGLPQDCLPVTVQETIKTGPELGEVEKRALDMLERILKNLKL